MKEYIELMSKKPSFRCKINGVEIFDYSLFILVPGAWINDEIVDACATAMEE